MSTENSAAVAKSRKDMTPLERIRDIPNRIKRTGEPKILPSTIEGRAAGAAAGDSFNAKGETWQNDGAGGFNIIPQAPGAAAVTPANPGLDAYIAANPGSTAVGYQAGAASPAGVAAATSPAVAMTANNPADLAAANAAGIDATYATAPLTAAPTPIPIAKANYSSPEELAVMQAAGVVSSKPDFMESVAPASVPAAGPAGLSPEALAAITPRPIDPSVTGDAPLEIGWEFDQNGNKTAAPQAVSNEPGEDLAAMIGADGRLAYADQATAGAANQEYLAERNQNQEAQQKFLASDEARNWSNRNIQNAAVQEAALASNSDFNATRSNRAPGELSMSDAVAMTGGNRNAARALIVQQRSGLDPQSQKQDERDYRASLVADGRDYDAATREQAYQDKIDYLNASTGIERAEKEKAIIDQATAYAEVFGMEPPKDINEALKMDLQSKKNQVDQYSQSIGQIDSEAQSRKQLYYEQALDQVKLEPALDRAVVNLLDSGQAKSRQDALKVLGATPKFSEQANSAMSAALQNASMSADADPWFSNAAKTKQALVRSAGFAANDYGIPFALTPDGQAQPQAQPKAPVMPTPPAPTKPSTAPPSRPAAPPAAIAPVADDPNSLRFGSQEASERFWMSDLGMELIDLTGSMNGAAPLVRNEVEGLRVIANEPAYADSVRQEAINILRTKK